MARPAELRLVTVQARNGGIANQAQQAFSNTDNIGLSDTVKGAEGPPSSAFGTKRRRAVSVEAV